MVTLQCSSTTGFTKFPIIFSSYFSKVTIEYYPTHQGLWHSNTSNDQPHNRYIQHVVYSAPWLVQPWASLSFSAGLHRRVLKDTYDHNSG